MGQRRPEAKEFTRNLAEYPDRCGYLWKAAATISTEICEAVLGMAASLSNFAKEKTRQNRNEPVTAKMTHGTGRRDRFAISSCVLRILLEADINNI